MGASDWVALVLVGVAFTYSSVLPFGLADRPELRRTPKAMLWLWQSLAVGGIVAALGAGMLALKNWLHPGVSLSESLASVIAGGLAVMVVGRLILTGHRVGRHLRAIRARHRELVDVLGRADALDDSSHSDLRMIEVPLPVAYCLPGWRDSRIVVANRAVQLLSSDQLSAVLAHERAHLAGRHDLLAEGFTVLQRAFPQAIAGRLAQQEVEILIELLADRVATRQVATSDLLSALEQMADIDPTRPNAESVSGSIAVRRQMLTQPSQPKHAQGVGLLLLAVGLMSLPIALIIWSVLN